MAATWLDEFAPRVHGVYIEPRGDVARLSVGDYSEEPDLLITVEGGDGLEEFVAWLKARIELAEVAGAADARASRRPTRVDVCPKCGGTDQHRRWMPGQALCGYSRRNDFPHVCRGVRTEHIDVTCRGCQFVWNEVPLDAESSAKEATDVE